MKALVLSVLFTAPLVWGTAAHGQTLVQDTVLTMKARVQEIVSSERKEIPGTNVESTYQTIKALIIDGPEKGTVVTVENDYMEQSVGDVFYLSHHTNDLDGTDYYSVSEPYRLPQIAILLALFIGLVVWFGGKQGIRGLIALAGSFAFIIFLLLPGILHGYPPILVAVGVASLIIILGSYVTHGLNRTTSVAVIGMIATVVLTGALAYWAVPFAHLSGFTDDEAVYLNFNTRGTLDLAGLLIGGMLIGVLGVLYDAAIGQAVTVEELSSAAQLTRAEIYRRALRVGREHIGALVNTLAIAYVGTALPLLLLFFGYGTGSIAQNINRELFATEIVRAIIGSIGLVLAVPVTTWIAVRMLHREPAKE